MGNISKTPERIKRFDFGEYPQGSETYHLIIPAYHSSIRRDDLQTLSGKRVGVNAGSYQMKLFQDWLEKKEIRDLLTVIEDTFSLTFEYRSFESYPEILNALHNGTIDVAMPVYFDYWVAEKQKVALIDEVISSSVSLISDYRSSKVNFGKIAISDKYFFQSYYVMARYPEAEYIWCKDLEECLAAIKKGRADCTFFNSDLLQVMRPDYPELMKLEIQNLRTFTSVSMAVRPGERELISILNKGVAIMSASDISSSMVAHAHQAGFGSMTVLEMIREHAIELLIILALVLGTLLIGVLHAYKRAVNQERLINEQKELAEHQTKLLEEALAKFEQADSDRRTDFLTGLHNRQEMFETLKRALAGHSRPIREMYMMDIDNFKKLNDRYGHARGDDCLKAISKALLSYSKENDIQFFRYGGEEILGIGFAGTLKSPGCTADELVRLVSGLKIQHEDSETGYVTISLGYTTTNKRYEKMIDLADSAMYYAKKHGKNRAVCYEELSLLETRLL